MMLHRWLGPTSALLAILIVLQPTSAFFLTPEDFYSSSNEQETPPWLTTRQRRTILDDGFPSPDSMQVDPIYPSHFPLIFAALNAVKARNRRFTQATKTYVQPQSTSFSPWSGKRSLGGFDTNFMRSHPLFYWRGKRSATFSPVRNGAKDRIRRDTENVYSPEEEQPQSVVPKPTGNVGLLFQKVLSKSEGKVSFDQQKGPQQDKIMTKSHKHSLKKRSIRQNPSVGHHSQDLSSVQAGGEELHLPAPSEAANRRNGSLGYETVPERTSAAFKDTTMSSNFNNENSTSGSGSEDLIKLSLYERPASQGIPAGFDQREMTQSPREQETAVRPDARFMTSEHLHAEMTSAGGGDKMSRREEKASPVSDLETQITHNPEDSEGRDDLRRNAVTRSQWHQPVPVNQLGAQYQVPETTNHQIAHDDTTRIIDKSQSGVGPVFWVEPVPEVGIKSDQTKASMDSTSVISFFGSRSDPTISDINANRELLSTLTSRAFRAESEYHHQQGVSSSNAAKPHLAQNMDIGQKPGQPFHDASENLRQVERNHQSDGLRGHTIISPKTPLRKDRLHRHGTSEHWRPVFRNQHPKLLRQQRLHMPIAKSTPRVNLLQKPYTPAPPMGNPAQDALKVTTQHMSQPYTASPVPPPEMDADSFLNHTLTTDLRPIKQMGLGALPFGDLQQDSKVFPPVDGAGLMGTHADVQEDTPYGKRVIKYQEFAVLSTKGGITLSTDDKGYLRLNVAVLNDNDKDADNTDTEEKKRGPKKQTNSTSNEANKTRTEDNVVYQTLTGYQRFYSKLEPDTDDHSQLQHTRDSTVTDVPAHSQRSGTQSGQDSQRTLQGHRAEDHMPENGERTVSPTSGEDFLSELFFGKRYDPQTKSSSLHPKHAARSHRARRSVQSQNLSDNTPQEQVTDHLQEQARNSSRQELLDNQDDYYEDNEHDQEKEPHTHKAKGENSLKPVAKNTHRSQGGFANKDQDSNARMTLGTHLYGTLGMHPEKPLARHSFGHVRHHPDLPRRQHLNVVRNGYKPITTGTSQTYIMSRGGRFVPPWNFRTKPRSISPKPAVNRQARPVKNPAARDSIPKFSVNDKGIGQKSVPDEKPVNEKMPLTFGNSTLSHLDRVKQLLKVFNINFKIFLHPFSRNRVAGKSSHDRPTRQKRDHWGSSHQGHNPYFLFPLGNVGWVTFLQYGHGRSVPKPRFVLAKLK